MRVIGGELGSRRLKAPPGLKTRPIPDRLRESLFNILAPVIEGAVFVDAYAGSGAVGIEALSRGARRAVFIELGRTAASVIRGNLHSLGLTARADVLQADAARRLGTLQADIYFLGPPYTRPEEYTKALTVLGDGRPARVIAQHLTKAPLLDQYGRLRRYRQVTQGENTLSFYETIGES
jgi:16S rRNA (guanine(966)-N(2))-methyltransferase RsmD